jgi:uncharacterized small protein (DUF1192 family)
MDMDELFARKAADPLMLVTQQDLDPLSVEELQKRLEILAAEAARVKQKLEGAVNHRASADSLFKR